MGSELNVHFTLIPDSYRDLMVPFLFSQTNPRFVILVLYYWYIGPVVVYDAI